MNTIDTIEILLVLICFTNVLMLILVYLVGYSIITEMRKDK